ncbi:hypothetical protein HZS_2995, partial [Henneguya salminicola]
MLLCCVVISCIIFAKTPEPENDSTPPHIPTYYRYRYTLPRELYEPGTIRLGGSDASLKFRFFKNVLKDVGERPGFYGPISLNDQPADFDFHFLCRKATDVYILANRNVPVLKFPSKINYALELCNSIFPKLTRNSELCINCLVGIFDFKQSST